MAKVTPSEFTQKTAEELLTLMGVAATVTITETKENGEPTLNVNIETEQETGLLIGAHGSTLQAIQIFLGMALRQHAGEWQRVVVNVGDWKEKQEESLRQLAESTAARARQTEEDQHLYNLNSAQRRIVHMILAEEVDLETESTGEGEERYLIVRIKRDAK
jgi:spoIIIJ-associated protein